MRHPPSIWITTPMGFVLGAAMGTILAAFWLTFALQLDVNAFDALTVWTAPAYLRQIHPEAFRIAYGVVGASAFALAAASMVLASRRPSTEYGTAAWQTRAELKRNRMLGELGTGFVAGKLGGPRSRAPFVLSTTQPHVLMVAPTRAGKGVGFVIPNLMSCGGSVVVLDVKGENFEKTARLRARLGDEVWRFSPFDWEHGTHRYNPLARIARLADPHARFTELSVMADLFLEGERRGDVFLEAGKTIFVAACLLAIQRGTASLGASNVIVHAGADKNATYRSYALEANDPHLKALWTTAASASDRLLTSNVQALMSSGFKAWDNPAVRAATDESDFDFRTFRSARQALYLAVSEDHIKTLAPVMRLLFGDLITTLRHHEPRADEPFPVMLMIDEFQQMGAMTYLEQAIHTLASYGGRVAMIAQSIAALDKLYGTEGRESLESGAGLKLYIAPRDPRTAREVSQAVGKTTHEALTRSWGRTRELFGARSHSARLEERPLLSETDARMLDPDRVVILAGSQQPILAYRLKYYEDRAFRLALRAQEGMELPWPPHRETLVAGVGPQPDDVAGPSPELAAAAWYSAPRGPLAATALSPTEAAYTNSTEDNASEPASVAVGRIGAGRAAVAARIAAAGAKHQRVTRIGAQGALPSRPPALTPVFDSDQPAPTHWEAFFKKDRAELGAG